MILSMEIKKQNINIIKSLRIELHPHFKASESKEQNIQKIFHFKPLYRQKIFKKLIIIIYISIFSFSIKYKTIPIIKKKII